MSFFNYRMPWLLIMSCGLCLALCHPSSVANAATGDIIIIANKQAEVRQIDRAEARSIFSLSRKYWPNGVRVQVFILSSDASVTHVKFCQQVLNVYPYILERAWLRKVSSGDASKGNTVATEKELIEYVRKTPGAIGYVNATEPLPADVVVVEILP